MSTTLLPLPPVHADQCGYDANDDGTYAQYDATCPACRVHLFEAGELRCLCCDGPDGAGIWHFDSVAALRRGLDDFLPKVPEDPCDVETGDPLYSPLAFDSFQDADAWLFARDEDDAHGAAEEAARVVAGRATP